jgi:hypothetical protein
MSRERVFEMTAEVRSLIEAQEILLSDGATFVEMSVAQLTEYAQRHARIGELAKELQAMSHRMAYAPVQKEENIN